MMIGPEGPKESSLGAEATKWKETLGHRPPPEVHPEGMPAMSDGSANSAPPKGKFFPSQCVRFW